MQSSHDPLIEPVPRTELRSLRLMLLKVFKPNSLPVLEKHDPENDVLFLQMAQASMRAEYYNQATPALTVTVLNDIALLRALQALPADDQVRKLENVFSDRKQLFYYIDMWLEQCKNADEIANEGKFMEKVIKDTAYYDLVTTIHKRCTLEILKRELGTNGLFVPHELHPSTLVYLGEHRNSFITRGIYQTKTRQIYDTAFKNIDLARTLLNVEIKKFDEELDKVLNQGIGYLRYFFG